MLQVKAIEFLKDTKVFESLPRPKLRNPLRLAADIHRVLDYPEVRKHLAETELWTFHGKIPKWAEICKRLQALGIPNSTVHFNLWDRNVAVSQSNEKDMLFF